MKGEWRHGFEDALDVADPPAELWGRIATAEGLASWMGPATVEEREGGAYVVEVPGLGTAAATIVTWDPPRRLVHDEHGWAARAGWPEFGPVVTPLRTELTVVPERSDASLLRILVMAYGSGEAWEEEFFQALRTTWLPRFDALRR